MKVSIATLFMVLAACPLFAAEYHVAVTGSDNHAGSKSKPFKTISAAAQVAQPGDVITVHEGIYRERVNPPRGGASDDQRIVYRAAPGETVVIKGSEVINITHGDERYYNNMFVRRGLSIYDELDKWDRAHLLKALDLQAAGNVYLSGAKPSSYDRNAWVVAHFDPEIKLQESSDGWWLEMAVDPSWASKEKRVVVTTKELGRAKGPDALFEQPDGTPYRLDTDYFGKKRNPENPAPGPFKSQAGKEIRLKVWPKK